MTDNQTPVTTTEWPGDPEIAACAKVAEALGTLGPEQRRRVLNWASARFEPPALADTVDALVSEILDLRGRVTTDDDVSEDDQ